MLQFSSEGWCNSGWQNLGSNNCGEKKLHFRFRWHKPNVNEILEGF